MIRKEDCYKIGKITKTHGLKGELNFTFSDDIWCRMPSSYIICEVDGILVPFFLEEYRFRSDTTALVKIEDIDTADAAQFLVNSDVYYENKYVVEDDADEVSLNYFIGFGVTDRETDKQIGTITDIDDNTENWLFIVECPDGKEVLIPANEAFITDIDHEQKTIMMELPAGLLDL